ncbi:Neuropeptide FF receptor 2 [Trichoplax sp. H2]|nr:Neuropeptide FF receptor 2 [Trichoplax sp. H2]|eukprot:RDD37896.1 Neuropeptide FF receptor 2 [Trichoplax sp. H2]
MEGSTVSNSKIASANLSTSFSNGSNSPVSLSFPPIVLSGFTLFGLITNGLICWATAKTKRLHTPTFCLVVNMAISDCIILVTGLASTIINAIMSSMAVSVISATIACKLIGFTSICGVITSTLTLSAISIDRTFILTTKSRRRTLFNSNKKLNILVGLIWLIAAIVALPFGVLMTVFPSSPICDIKNISRTFNGTYFIILFIVAYMIPAITVIIMYTKIIVVLAKGISKQRNLSAFELTRKHHIKLIKTLSIVTVIFFLLAGPLFIIYIIIALSGKSAFNYMLSLSRSQAQILQICFIALYLSSLLNPIIYFFMNSTLRQALTCKSQCYVRLQPTIHVAPAN